MVMSVKRQEAVVCGTPEGEVPGPSDPDGGEDDEHVSPHEVPGTLNAVVVLAVAGTQRLVGDMT